MTEIELAHEVYDAFEELAKKIDTFLMSQFEAALKDEPKSLMGFLNILSSVWPIIKREKFNKVAGSMSFDREDLVEFAVTGLFIRQVYEHSPEAFEKFVGELPDPGELFQSIVNKGEIQ